MASPPDNDTSRLSLQDSIRQLSAAMLSLAPGPLAELRRMEAGGIGAPAYWRLAANAGFLDGSAETWMRIVKIMAILTPRGTLTGAERLHQDGNGGDGRCSLGAVLCDGGDPGWPPKGRPVHNGVFSEKRLARFLALPAAARGPALERIARTLASTRDVARGIDCVEIASLLLHPGNDEHPRRIAREYYRRLDRAVRANEKGESGE